MKTIVCLDCAQEFTGDTPEEVQMKILPHYREAHPEIINNVDNTGRKEWMEKFTRRWEAASEN